MLVSQAAMASSFAGAQGDRPIRLLTLTTLFPNACRPRHGIFVANRLARLRDTGRIEASVVAAVPWFPGVYRDEVPRSEEMLGMHVRHPRYLHVPRLGMRIQPASLARTLIGEARRMDEEGKRFDVVDAHYFYPDGVAAAQVAQALGVPLVISGRGSDINVIADIPFARERILRAARQADAVISVSAALASRMVAVGIARERIQVLRNGVDMRMFFPEPRALARRGLGLDVGARLVLGVGNLVAEKGFDLLIRAVAKLDAYLLLIGEGPAAPMLRALAAREAPDRVDFRANVPQSELRFAYSAADVFALPSMREGWPNVVLEAIACGTPVVASPAGGVPEILDSQAPGLLVEERDAEAWARALNTMLEARRDPEEVRRYAGRFGWDEVVSAQCALYERVVAANRARAARRAA